MQRRPLVSVLMSVHNGSRYLRAAIESIRSQTLRDLEFIIVDDASTDDASEICADAASRDPRIIVLTNERRLGLTRSLNRALAVATGTYIARMDGDDISLPSRLERQVAYLEARPGVGLVGSWYSEIDAAGAVTVPLYSFPVEPIIVSWRMAFENPLPHPPIVARRALIAQVGGYDERWETAQDYDLFTRLAPITRLANYPDVLFQWRRHCASMSTTRDADQRHNAARICRSYVSRLIGAEVDAPRIELLWRREPQNVDEAVAFVSTAVDVCRALERDARWSRQERRVLRRYVSRKLVYELTPYAGEPRANRLLGTLALLSPSLVMEMVGRRLAGRTPIRAVRRSVA
jgi:glycosyltransferase involved in cell wall biosynthesis